MRKTNLIMVALIALAAGLACAVDESGEWLDLFDGKTMNGWKASENKGSWKIEDGKLVCSGPRSHLFYQAARPFRNFHFKA